MIVVLAVVGGVEVGWILGKRALGNVDSHTADIERCVSSASLDSCAAASHLVNATATAATNEFLIKLVVQGTAVLIAVQGVVQPRWVQVVVWILEGEQPVLCKRGYNYISFIYYIYGWLICLTCVELYY